MSGTRLGQAVLFTMLVWQIALGMELRGKVVLAGSGCPVAGLSVEIAPKEGSSQTKVITTTDSGGVFDANVSDGTYLIQIFQAGRKVYQQVIADTIVLPLDIVVQPSDGILPKCSQFSATNAKDTFTYYPRDTRDWRPNDLSYSGDAGLLVLDDYGRIIKIVTTTQGVQSEPLFSIRESGRFSALASEGNRVFVTADRSLGCTVYDFDGSTNRPHLLNPGYGACTGVATDGKSIVTGFPDSSQIRFFQKADFRFSHSFELPGYARSYEFVFDPNTMKLYIGTSRGAVYQASFEDKSHPKQIVSGLERISSLALSTRYLLITSGSHISCYQRSDFKPLRLSDCMDTGVKGQLVGVRVDDQDHAWILERGPDAIVGPVVLK
jgi:hypothetical protein